jgi:hypothetical protein
MEKRAIGRKPKQKLRKRVLTRAEALQLSILKIASTRTGKRPSMRKIQKEIS